jgi:hypothetical protein
MIKNFTKKLLILLPMLFSMAFVFAQGVTTGSMSGVITESNGQTVPGASVTAIHKPSGTTYSTQTRADGRFNLPNMRIGGPYTVKVSFVGSTDYIVNDINLNLGQEYSLKAKLLNSTVSLGEVIVKSSQNKVINSNRTGARETVTRSQIDALPTVGRSLSDFTKLTPSANVSPGGTSFGGRSQSYNNLTVDGALFNNSFGLSGSLGGQTNSQPISLDAIEQIQVDIAPYDVRQGFFTGAGVNTVTKSGTNEFKGTGYFFFRNPTLIGLEAGPFTNKKQDFSYNTRGVAVGGPLIKNKLFFFLSAEQERLEQPGSLFSAATPTSTPGGNVSQATASDLDGLKQFLNTKYGYNPGDYQGYNNKTQSDKIAFKIDWNINKNNTLSAKYFYLKSARDVPPSNSGAINNTNRQPSLTTLPFSGSGYVINNNFNIGIVELNSRFGNKFSNKLSAGYSALRDFRDTRASGIFPMVDIGNGNGGALTSFGYEPFTANNVLSTNTIQFSDDFSIYAGKHEITLGTNNQINSFVNGFAPSYYGNYNFNSLADFYASANNGISNATRYQLRYSALPDKSFPFAKLKVSQYSIYVQDKWAVTNDFKLTYGIRADYNSLPGSLDPNPNLAALTFRDGVKIDVSQFPKAKVLFSPRVGFNYNVNGDGETQIRGGAGIFTGQVPFVWLSNQASNNGVQFGSVDLNQTNTPVSSPNRSQLIFNPNVDANRPATAQANTSYNVAVTDPNFKLPQVFRLNGAVDQKLPYGIIGTLEGVYTKDINAVLFQNVNLPIDGTPLAGSDSRIRYSANRIYGPAKSPALNTLTNPNISDAIVFKNTNKGYSYFITGQLQKQFTNGFMASIAYTYGKSKSVNDGGSIAQSIWRDRNVQGDPNANELGYSNFYQPNRIISYISYRKEYAKNFATSIGVTFESSPNGNYSLTYRGDLNNDGLSGNDLMYVPKNINDIVLVKDNVSDTRTPAQIWSQLDAFINQDPYLSKNRGKVVERGAALLPYLNLFNLNLTQDFYLKVAGKRQTLRFTADVINVANLLNRNWGLSQSTGIGASQPLSYKGLVSTAPNAAYPQLVVAAGDANIGKPGFSFPFADDANKIPITSSYRINTASLWQAQFGIRYIFN